MAGPLDQKGIEGFCAEGNLHLAARDVVAS